MTWLVLIVLAFLIPEILSTVLESRLGRALAARIESGAGGPDSQTLERIRALEGEVDRLSEDLRRVSEESEFLHRLLMERPERREIPSHREGSIREGAHLPPGDPRL